MSTFFKKNPNKFTSEMYSVGNLLSSFENGNSGFVIPDYQRDYTWEGNEIDRFIDDLLTGFSRQSSNYLGAILFCKRSRPQTDGNSFSGVSSYDIVDGQQRLTSCILFAISLLISISRHREAALAFLASDESLRQSFIAIEDRIKQFLSEMFHGTFGSFHGKTPFPRIIHEEDVRGITTDSNYQSPLAVFQLDTCDILPTLREDFDINSLSYKEDNYENVCKRLKDNFNTFYAFLDKISEKSFYDERQVDYVQGNELSDVTYLDYFENPASLHAQAAQIRSLLVPNTELDKYIRLLLLAAYFTDYSCFSIISCEQEDDAFAIFDSLNTTGVPLTPIETLKPWVIREYRTAKREYIGSDADKHFQALEGNIRKGDRSTSDQASWSIEAVIHSLLLGCGEKGGRKLNNLRSSLRVMHDSCIENSHIDLVPAILHQVLDYKSSFFLREGIRNFYVNELSASQLEEIKLINTVLADMRVTLAIPLLTRFFWDAHKTQKYDFYIKACKIIIAFLCLRRATASQTDSQDQILRNCLQGDGSSFDGFQIRNNYPKTPTLEEMDKFRNYLVNNLGTTELQFTLKDKDKWVDHVSKLGLYRRQKTLLKYFLILAHHHTVVDQSDNTLIVKGAVPASSNNFASLDRYDAEVHKSIEHVAPQKGKASGWHDVYDDDKTREMLGNFTLLPSTQNSSLSNLDWNHKKLFFEVLMAEKTLDRNRLITEGDSNGIKIPKKLAKQLTTVNVPQSDIIKGLENVNKWDKTYIEKRTRRLLELVWDELTPWLQP